MGKQNTTPTLDYTVETAEGETHPRRAGPSMAAAMIGSDLDRFGPVVTFRAGRLAFRVDTLDGEINGQSADVRSGAIAHLLAGG